jgi:hypothetical protein
LSPRVFGAASASSPQARICSNPARSSGPFPRAS